MIFSGKNWITLNDWFMDEQIHKLLKDILNGISNIELFCSSRPKEYQVFCEDRCFRSAVQWEIAIIGRLWTEY